MQVERIFEDRIQVRPGPRTGLLDPTLPDAVCIQFSEPLPDEDHQRLGEWFAAHPEAHLRVFGNYAGRIRDIEFLRYYPRLRGFQIDSMYSHPVDLAGLRFLPDDLRLLGLNVKRAARTDHELRRFTMVETLALGQVRRLPDAIADLSRVRHLSIAGPVKDLGILEALPAVQDLSLRSVTVPHLEPLLAMEHLAHLDISLGGTRDLTLLPRIGRLRHLSLWQIRGLDDVSFIRDLECLSELVLQALKNVASLPDLDRLPNLTRVTLETMKGLRDLAPLRTAPALEELQIVDARHLAPEDLEPLVGHPTLSRVRIGLGSDRKNTAARNLLGLPDCG